MNPRFEAYPRHAQRFTDAALCIDGILLRQHVQDTLPFGNCPGTGRVDHPINIGRHDFALLDRHHAIRVHRADMATRHSDIHRMNIAARHQLGFFNRTLDRLNRRFNIDHHTLFHTAGGVRPNAGDLDTAVIGCLSDNGHNLGCSDIQPDYHVGRIGSDCHAPECLLKLYRE